MIQAILAILLVYVICGLLFVVPFITKGLGRIDEGAKDSTIGFRIIIIPGVIVFWPFLLKKWITVKQVEQDEAT